MKRSLLVMTVLATMVSHCSVVKNQQRGSDSSMNSEDQGLFAGLMSHFASLQLWGGQATDTQSIPAPPQHDSHDLAASYSKLQPQIDYFRPEVIVAPQYASNTCSHRNPDHHILATGSVLRQFGEALTYHSSIDLDLGMGRGIIFSQLTVAYVLRGDQGDRVVIVRGHKTVAMHPFANYTGAYPSWPSKSLSQVEASGNTLTVRDDDNHALRFERVAEDTYLLTAMQSSYRWTSVDYNQNGIANIRSSNRCDDEVSYEYVDGMLSKVTRDNGIQTLSDRYYFSNNLLHGYASSRDNTPKIGELPNQYVYRLHWSKSNLVNAIYDGEDQLIEGFVYYYKDQTLEQHVLPGETRIYQVNHPYAGKTTLSSTKTKLSTETSFEHCRLSSQTVVTDQNAYEGSSGYLVDGVKKFRVKPTDIKHLELSAVMSHQKGTVTVSNNLDWTSLLVKSQETTEAQDYLPLKRQEFEYDEYGRVTVAKSIRDFASEWSYDYEEEAEDTSIQTFYTYQGRQLKSVESPQFTRRYSYNSHGKVVSVVGPGVHTSYEYDQDGLLTMQRDELRQRETRFEYTSLCQLKKKIEPTVTTTFAYKADGRIEQESKDGLGTHEKRYFYRDNMGYTTVLETVGENSMEKQYDYWGNLLFAGIQGQEYYNYEANQDLTAESDVMP